MIVEGARGTGKSTITQKLRSTYKNSTLINFTGFEEDGQSGLDKIVEYYYNWFEHFRNLKINVKDQLIICDRFFPSEMVYSSLYKDYDFTTKYKLLCKLLPTLADEVTVLNFQIHSKSQLADRLNRDKIPFGKAEESVTETLKQQVKYNQVLAMMDREIGKAFGNNPVNIIKVDTTYKSMNQVFDEVKSRLNEQSLT